MTFDIEVDGKLYKVEPVGETKLSYRVYDGDGSYDLKMDSDGEWIVNAPHFKEPPFLVEDVGKEIEKFFG